MILLPRIVSIAVILVTFASAAKISPVSCPTGRKGTQNKCCSFYALRDDLQDNLFKHQCGTEARQSLRLTFHDAISFSSSDPSKGGGADGSLLVFDDIETQYFGNTALIGLIKQLKPYISKYGVSAGDLVQFAGAVGLSNCAGAPRLQFLAGRPNPVRAAVGGLLPSPASSVDQILARMRDAGFSAEELVFLLASHSLARAPTTDISTKGVPPKLDSTPAVMDSQFYLETLMKGTGFPGNGKGNGFAEVQTVLPSRNMLRLQSDFALARDNRTACSWQALIGDRRTMVEGFRKAMAKLAVVNQNVKNLVDCSDAVPATTVPDAPDARFPSGTSSKDLQQTCPSAFPKLKGHGGYSTPHEGPGNGNSTASGTATGNSSTPPKGTSTASGTPTDRISTSPKGTSTTPSKPTGNSSTPTKGTGTPPGTPISNNSTPNGTGTASYPPEGNGPTRGTPTVNSSASTKCTSSPPGKDTSRNNGKDKGNNGSGDKDHDVGCGRNNNNENHEVIY